MRSIAFYNNKGGVGKTTSVINIAYQLAANKSVLVIDVDGQANCSRFFTDEPKEPKGGLERALTEEAVTRTVALSETRYPNIDIISATSKLNDIVSLFYALSEKQQRENAAKLINAAEPYYKDYDYILVDLPPALNKITERIISACDFVFVPIELSSFAIQGISTVTNIIADCGARFGGCFVNKYDRENPSDVQLMEMLKSSLGTKALNGFLPFSRVIKNSVSYNVTAPEYMGWTFAAECVANLAKEIAAICGEV